MHETVNVHLLPVGFVLLVQVFERQIDPVNRDGEKSPTHSIWRSPHLFYLLFFSCSIFGVNIFLSLYNSRFIIKEWYRFETAESREAVFLSSAFARENDSVLCNIETIRGQ